MNATYRVNVRKTVRPASTSFYIPVPRELVQQLGIVKGQTLDWTFRTRNILTLKPITPASQSLPKKNSAKRAKR